MEPKGILCVDMDGTIADLYGIPNWLEKIETEDPTPYSEAKPLVDMRELRKVLLEFQRCGWQIRVISWLSKTGTEAYNKAVRKAKREWLERYNFPFETVHIVAYGTTKADCVRHLRLPSVLIDDNTKVRDGWHLGETIDPQSCDLVEELKKFLKEFQKSS